MGVTGVEVEEHFRLEHRGSGKVAGRRRSAVEWRCRWVAPWHRPSIHRPALSRICHNSGRRLAGEAAALAHAAAHGQEGAVGAAT